MHKAILMLAILFTGLQLLFSQAEVPTAITEGQLTVSVTTAQTSSPKYAPSNILAIYILDSQTRFVKTLLAYAGERRQYLVNWKSVTTVAGSAYNTVDAITGATRNSHGTRSCTWNGKNRSGVSVDDGTYTVRFELTDNDGQKQNLASFTINKGAEEQNLTPAAVTGFSNISISWKPVNTAVESVNDTEAFQLYPNQAGTQLTVQAKDFSYAELFELNGRLLQTSTNAVFNIGKLAHGSYLVLVYDKNHRKKSKTFVK